MKETDVKYNTEKNFVTNPRDVRLMGKQRTAGHGLNSITAAAEADSIRYREVMK